MKTFKLCLVLFLAVCCAHAAILIVQPVGFTVQGDGVTTIMKVNPANLSSQQSTPLNLPLVGVAINPGNNPSACGDPNTGNQYAVSYSVAGGKLIVTFVQPPPNGVLVQCGVNLTYTPQ
jgi:hypothetical protein